MSDISNGQSSARNSQGEDLLVYSADIVAAFVGQNRVPPEQLPELIRSVHQTLSSLGGNAAAAAPSGEQARQKPAVPISKSVNNDYIVCLEDGAKLKMLKRYLRSRYDMSPEEYRRKWGLPPDYPMVAPAYAQRRSEFARQIGLGKGVRRK
ncbi:MAG TPA: MucR family transcriptional regulator [Caulobacteraceae bacterium]|nr:MucR family transcriptional regulator [Caulobacteraceae bacterium]